MKNYYFIFFILFFVSCDDYLDVNTDPNRATTADPGPLFTGIITQYSTNRVIDLGPALSTASQGWSGGGSLGAGVFTRPENYIFSVFTTGNTWRTYYRNMQKNLALAIQGSQDIGDANAEAQCRIMSAYAFYSATVLWGDVPYSQAVDVDFSVPEITNQNPAFDPQQEVLRGVASDLNAAIALIDGPQSNAIGANDLVYGGNMDLWRKFAKSLLFRTYMTMVDADPSVAGEINKLISEGDMISSSAENAAFPFFDQAGNRNPFWGTLDAFAGGSNFFYFAGEKMVDIMTENSDPRLNVYFTPYPAGGSPEDVTGAPPGVTNIGFTPWVLSTSTSDPSALVRPDAADVWFSYSEQSLLEAEAIIRGLADGGAAEADTRLRNGIFASMTVAGVTGTEDDETPIEDYIASIPDLSTISEAEAREIIANELFIDCIIRPLESFTHQRRSDLPALELPAQAQTTNLIGRLPYPPDELSANDNAPEVLPDVDDKMWFDVN